MVRLLGGVALLGVVWLLEGVAMLLEGVVRLLEVACLLDGMARRPLGKGAVCLVRLEVSNQRNMISQPGMAEIRSISSGVWYRMELTSWHRVLRTVSGAWRNRCSIDMNTSMCEM